MEDVNKIVIYTLSVMLQNWGEIKIRDLHKLENTPDALPKPTTNGEVECWTVDSDEGFTLGYMEEAKIPQRQN